MDSSDQSVMDSSDSRRRADAGSLADHPQREECTFVREPRFSAGFAVVRFGVGLPALITAKPSKTIQVSPKLLAVDSAVVARHYRPCFLQAKGPK
jgi:hypothetical protein